MAAGDIPPDDVRCTYENPYTKKRCRFPRWRELDTCRKHWPDRPERCVYIRPHTGERCAKDAAKGSDKCPSHNAQKIPAVRRRLALVRAEEKIQKAAVKYGIDPVTDPIHALSNLAGEITTFKDICRAEIETVNRNEWRYEGRTGEQLYAFVALYERSLDRASKILADMARLDLDARLARVDEARVQLVIGAVERATRVAGLSVEMREQIRQKIAQEILKGAS